MRPDFEIRPRISFQIQLQYASALMSWCDEVCECIEDAPSRKEFRGAIVKASRYIRDSMPATAHGLVMESLKYLPESAREPALQQILSVQFLLSEVHKSSSNPKR